MEKIATISVSVDHSSDGSSRSRFDQHTKHGEIELSINNSQFPIRSKDELADVLAHELGHIVGEVLEIPAQVESHSDLFMQNFAGIVTPALYRTEQKAWEIADKIRGGRVDKDLAQAMLQTYKDSLITSWK